MANKSRPKQLSLIHISQRHSLILERKGCKNLLIRLAVKARGREVQKTMAKYTKRRDTVSYTHLDVYKRQGEIKEGMSGSLLIGIKKPLCWRGDTRK